MILICSARFPLLFRQEGELALGDKGYSLQDGFCEPLHRCWVWQSSGQRRARNGCSRMAVGAHMEKLLQEKLLESLVRPPRQQSPQSSLLIPELAHSLLRLLLLWKHVHVLCGWCGAARLALQLHTCASGTNKILSITSTSVAFSACNSVEKCHNPAEHLCLPFTWQI